MNSQDLMKSIIQRVATGPDLSKDIAFEEARDGMQAILRGEIDDVRTGLINITPANRRIL
jgi:anthranilate phosphoribosyltransferase